MVGKKLSGIKITSFTHMSVTWLEGRKPRKAYITYMHCKIKSTMILKATVSYAGIAFFYLKVVVEFKWDLSNFNLERAGNCQAIVRQYSSHCFVCFQLVLRQSLPKPYFEIERIVTGKRHNPTMPNNNLAGFGWAGLRNM